MQIEKIKFNQADIEFLQKRKKKLNEIGLQQSINGEDFLQTQDAALRIECWILLDEIINKKNPCNEKH